MSDLTTLVADADRALGDFLCHELAADVHHAIYARSADHARALARHKPPDVLVLGDFDSPGAATDLLRALRAGELYGDGLDGELPVLAISERDSELHRVRLLDLGADDAMTKPVTYTEVRARLNAILRRTRPTTRGRIVRVGALTVDTLGRLVTVFGRRVELSQVEWRLLCHLLSDPTRVYTKDELLRDVWGIHTANTTRTLDSHACRLRRKLNEDGAGYVQNIWGVGYRLIDPLAVGNREEEAA